MGELGEVLVLPGVPLGRLAVRRTGGRYALVTMCIGGRRGIAAIFERVVDVR